MQQAAYGMNETVINDIFPTLIPAIASKAGLTTKPIDVFDAMGGADKERFPEGGCTLGNSNVADCKEFCDEQSCDQCHPNDAGYSHMAQVMKRGLGL